MWKGISILAGINGFDPILDLPIDEMHAINLGIVKKIFDLSFHLKRKDRRATRLRLNERTLNNLVRQIKVVREFSRRTRTIDFSKYKAEEWRNLVYVYGPAIYRIVPRAPEFQGVYKIWMLTIFLVRVYNSPPYIFDTFSPGALSDYTQMWYKSYEKEFGAAACSYNTHQFGAHLHLFRHNRGASQRIQLRV